jgi:hypothetical protein
LLVYAYINNKPAWLCVDSGAPITAVAEHRREHFRLTEFISDAAGPARIRINGSFDSLATVHSLQLGGLNLIDEGVVVVDLGNTSRVARLLHEPAIDGILGTDILFPTQAILDCERQVLILKLDPNIPGTAPGVSFRGYHKLPMFVSESFNLYVDSSINGIPARLMVDTGAFVTILHQSFVRQMQIPTEETGYRSTAVNLKQHGIQVATIRRLSLGRIHMESKDVGVIDLEGLIQRGLLEASPPAVGLLGAEILREHHGIIDFGTRTLYLKK